MPDVNVKQRLFCNQLLAALPVEEVERLRPHLHRVPLVLEQVLHEVGHPVSDVYFVEYGLVSLTADTGDDGRVEVGMIGNDGFVGTSALLDPDAYVIHRALVQIGGSAWRMRSAVLRQMVEPLPTLRDRSLRYAQALMAQTSQSVACSTRHGLPKRLARRLLMIGDRVDSDQVPTTQELLSSMLGVRRASVSAVVSALQAQGLIRQLRGRITIIDRAGLERAACNCYRLIENCRQQIMWV